MSESETTSLKNEPFKNRLLGRVQGKESELAFFENDNRYIVRIEPITEIKDKERFAEALEILRNVSDIKVPEYWDVVGDNNGVKSTFRVTKKVSGLSLGEYIDNPDGRIPTEVLSQFFQQIVDYLEHVYKNKLPVLGDIRPDQFMYGKVEEEQKEYLYLIDLDDFAMSRCTPIYLREVIKYCYQYISRLEKDLNLLIPLQKMLALLNSTAEELEISEDDRQNLNMLRPYLLNQIMLIEKSDETPKK